MRVSAKCIIFACDMEEFYQLAWKHRLFGAPDCRLCDGRPLRIITPGVLNTGAGPDFSHARLNIDGQMWCGNVEIHVRASDWLRHGHQDDPAYHTVLLHVVGVDDTRITRPDGSEIPQLQVTLPEGVEDTLRMLRGRMPAAICQRYIRALDRSAVAAWIERMGVERLQSKAQRVADIYRWAGGDWQQTLFVILARAMGFGSNADPMEMLGRSLPLNFAGRHADNRTQIEAMLFGQAALLNPLLLLNDEYYQYLCREYRFLAVKYNLHPLKGAIWKFGGSRPQNAPHRRIALLAKALEGGFSMMSQILDCKGDLEKLSQLLDISLDGYWAHHYNFGAYSGTVPKILSKNSIHLLVINAVVPFLYCYGAMTGDYRLQEQATDLLEAIPAERNSIVRSWMVPELTPDCAFRSQALLHLRREYCDRERCLECGFAHEFLRLSVKNARRQSIPS